ncbi:PREDICTED: uncharacterized protein LOC101297241 [Fragaria vesca subsp. vesca]|uniref:uncharacterized protein LOC101297241 n=1 Tax=Fragaria vesca subsp. vesca TaxID=101020 RepID=UPI0002C31A04|nr:PREDICTED: uncharacterized protein LOC101297241 [Fragaria vesca subsp. vesca]
MIICPCAICRNLSPQIDDDLEIHLMRYGVDPDYDIWCAHGEDAGPSTQVVDNESSDHIDVDYELPEFIEEEYKKKVEEAEVPLYPGCKKKYTKLSATLILYKFKADNGLATESFDELLEVFKDMLPDVNTFPESDYTIKKFLKEFDLGYKKIDACIIDCCLFRGEKKKNMQNCPECNAPRWYVNPRTNEINKGVPAKVLRYFPIIPRIQRMFLSASNSELLTWHSTHHSQDGMMRHPVDSIQWRTVDQKWPSFASEPRNLRFGLAADGFNPYKNLSSTHRNDIDVYLEPLIDDLKELWSNGVEIYDAYKRVMFNQKAILLWTINDFPAYGNLAGLTTKGEFACPVCGPETFSKWLQLANKTVYMCHRIFLAQNHAFRSKYKWFDGTKERRRRPKIFTGLAVVLSLCHNLDVMHIEKNVCESVLATILDVNGKSKIDNESHRNLELLELMEDVPNDEKRDKLELPYAPYTLTKVKKPKFCGKLYFQRFPDGYCSNITNCVKLQQCKIQGLKSHDHHVLMQQLLSVALKGLLPEGLRKAIWHLSSFFNELCQKGIGQKKVGRVGR